MDYLVIGSNGFAQMGNSAFYTKMKVEVKVLLDYFHQHFPIPRKFKTWAYYSKSIDVSKGEHLSVSSVSIAS